MKQYKTKDISHDACDMSFIMSNRQILRIIDHRNDFRSTVRRLVIHRFFFTV